MTQTWVSQIISSLDSLYNQNIDTDWQGKFWNKSWYNSKLLCEYCWFFYCDIFESKLCGYLQTKNLQIPLD